MSHWARSIILLAHPLISAIVDVIDVEGVALIAQKIAQNVHGVRLGDMIVPTRYHGPLPSRSRKLSLLRVFLSIRSIEHNPTNSEQIFERA